jgi:hypothetical protein
MLCEVIESGDQRGFITQLNLIYQAGLTALTDVLEEHREECGWTGQRAKWRRLHHFVVHSPVFAPSLSWETMVIRRENSQRVPFS